MNSLNRTGLLLIVAGSVAGGARLHAQEKITFNDHVMPIFRNACLNCHNPDKKKAGLDLSTYQGTLQGSENGSVVQSGNAGGSLLFKCVKGTEEPKMPPKGDRLTDAELGRLEKWIAGQLLETATGKAVAAANNNVQVAVVSLERPAGPPPMPGDLPLEPVVRTARANALTALGASPWAPLVAVGGQKQIILYNTETLQPLGILPFPEGFPAIIRFSRNGQVLLTGGGLGGKSGKVALWDVKSGERIATVGDEVDQVLAADLSADHQFVALGGPNKIVKIYGTKDGKLRHTIKKHTDWVTALAYSPEGKFLATADRNGGLQVWEGESAKEFNALNGHKGGITAVAFMTGVVASASEDGTVKLWDAKEGKEIKSWEAHKGGVQSVDFTPDGRLVSCGRDKLACVWDQTGKQLSKSPEFTDIALRAELNNERVIAGDWTGQIRVFAIDGKPLGELSSNPLPIAEQLQQTKDRLAKLEGMRPPLERALQALEEKRNLGTAAETGTKATPVEPAADLARKLEQQTAEVAKLREARAATASGTPEYNAANAQVQAKKAEIAATEAAIAAASQPVVPAAAQDEFTVAKAALEQHDAALASARAELVKWHRAEAYMSVYRASALLAEKQQHHDALAAAVAEAIVPAERVRQDIAILEKELAGAPEKVRNAAAAAAAAKAAAEPLRLKVTIAEQAQQQAENESREALAAFNKGGAEIAELTKKHEQQTAAIAKHREVRASKAAGTPEYAEADAKVQAAKPELAATEATLATARTKLEELKKGSEAPLAAIAKAREAAENSRTELKAAADLVTEAERTMAKVRSSSVEAAKQLADLRQRAPQTIESAKQAKGDAERELALAAKELAAAKTTAAQLRADFEGRWKPAEKTATAAAAAGIGAG